MLEDEFCAVGWCKEGGPCYCYLATRQTIIIISLLSLFTTVAECVFVDRCCCCCSVREHVDTVRSLLRMLFQVANVLLLIAAAIENSPLIQIYVWYTLGFIVLGFAVSILDLLVNMKHKGKWCLVNFLSEVAFLFVLYRCLPIVDMYRKDLEMTPTKPPGREL